MSEDDQESVSGTGLDRYFSLVVGLVLTLVFLVLPLCVWIGKKFLGWQPPGWVDQVLQFFGG